MPTICQLKASLKAKGVKGYSGLNKADLIKLLEGGKTEVKTPAKEPYPALPAKKKTTKATSANLNALYKAGKKKVLAIGYKEPPKPEPVKSAKAKGKEPMKKETVKDQVKKLVVNRFDELEKTTEGKKTLDDLKTAFSGLEEYNNQWDYMRTIEAYYEIPAIKKELKSGSIIKQEIPPQTGKPDISLYKERRDLYNKIMDMTKSNSKLLKALLISKKVLKEKKRQEEADISNAKHRAKNEKITADRLALLK